MLLVSETCYLGSTSDAAVASDDRKWQNETTDLVILLFHPVNNSCSQSGYESTLACVNAGDCSKGKAYERITVNLAWTCSDTCDDKPATRAKRID